MQQKGDGRDTPQYSTGPIPRDRAHSARSPATREITRSLTATAGALFYHRLADAGARWVAAVIACNFHYRLRESSRAFFSRRRKNWTPRYTKRRKGVERDVRARKIARKRTFLSVARRRPRPPENGYFSFSPFFPLKVARHSDENESPIVSTIGQSYSPK